MSLELALLILVIAVALIFDFTNGFHDAANAIATSVGTKALRPNVALAIAAVCNFIGAFLGQAVAKTVQSIVGDPGEGTIGLALVFAALAGAICWNLITWWFGLPSSSTHALIGGIVGSALVVGAAVSWSTVVDKVVIPMVISPVIGLLLAFMLMRGIRIAFRDKDAKTVEGRFRKMQPFSAAAIALGHGLQDAQKTMGIIVLALISTGHGSAGEPIPIWVVASCALAISLGTAAGGKKIMKTLGQRVIDLDPARGFSAEAVSASVLYVTAYAWHAPVSTTQVVTGAVIGAGAEKGRKRVRWSVGRNIAWAWVLTLPAAAAIAALVHVILRFFTGI